MIVGANRVKKLILPLAVTLAAASGVNAQQIHLDRLAPDQLEVAPPAVRVTGAPGRMQVVERECRMLPEADLRRRIVDIAVQEWGFFGFTVLDQTYIQDSQQRRSRRRLPRSWLDIAESARVADSIAGYWAVTDDGAWILDRQNDLWKGPYGVGVRWRDPWSAAFISWVMCEGGLGEEDLFRRHIAHYVYIDQAIEARYDESPDAAYVAYDVGERPIEPGDLLCSARRSAYRTIAERRRNIGRGVRSHCDIAVKVDAPSDRVLVIGGNVRGSVRLKVFAAEFGEYRDGAPSVRSVGGAGRTIFAHLKLRADPIEADALDSSPTVKALAERGDDLDWFRRRLEGDRPAQVGPPLASSADTISGPIPVL